MLLQIRCTNTSWTSADATKRKLGICQHKPYTSVSCQLRARNGDGYSEVVIRNTTTLCASKIHTNKILGKVAIREVRRSGVAICFYVVI